VVKPQKCTVVSETFSSGSALSFWVKGFLTDTSSSLLVEENMGSIWSEITDISDIPTGGTRIGSLTLNPSSSQQIRFSYTKSTGNIGLDDVRVEE